MGTTARDIMTRTVFTLQRDATLGDAADALGARGVSGAPVCDSHGRVVGVISRGDLADAALGTRARPGACVSDVMSLDVLAVAPDEPLSTVASRMVFEGVHRMVVLDADQMLIGIITPLDVLRVVMHAGMLGAAAPTPPGARVSTSPSER
jgi:predicted transcriptional regulator